MNWPNRIFLLGTAFLAVFLETSFHPIRNLTGVQVDLLPPLMVYAAVTATLSDVAILAFLGGIWFDSLSANPLGASVLPLLAVGAVIHVIRDLVLKDQTVAQVVLGLCASAATPWMTIVLLLTLGHKPILSWGTLWQWIFLSLSGAALTPLWFVVFDWLHRTLSHGRAPETSFRADREIRRGRA